MLNECKHLRHILTLYAYTADAAEIPNHASKTPLGLIDGVALLSLPPLENIFTTSRHQPLMPQHLVTGAK